ncbi:hypothetical protein AB0N81_29995 [Streptomyces sp. NPDC093510]|uniref:hypothetical protein n=1 Tax=Streptomyces sp. NPDC093510 TaxID=3155199 RepID=UPI0034325FB4
MPRPRTTTALLVSVAVSAAVSGCVSVERPTGAGPTTVTAPPPAPRTDGKNRPRIVQAPAREALERMGPTGRPSPKRTAAGPEPSPPPPSPDRPAAAPPRAPAPAAPVRRPVATRPDAGATRPARTTPPTAKGSDVCALGETYGKWAPGSPQAVICRETYGR